MARTPGAGAHTSKRPDLEDVVGVHLQAFDLVLQPGDVQVLLCVVGQFIIQHLVHDNLSVLQVLGGEVPFQQDTGLRKALRREILWGACRNYKDSKEVKQGIQVDNVNKKKDIENISPDSVWL